MVRSMSVKEYKAWIKKPMARCASLPKFFSSGVKRTINVLEGDASESSVAKRRAFLARHLAQYKKNPTLKRRIAIKNWGFVIKKSLREKNNC